jgi:hypothetical protein
VWLPGATHDSAVAAAADWLRAERARATKLHRVGRRIESSPLFGHGW